MNVFFLLSEKEEKFVHSFISNFSDVLKINVFRAMLLFLVRKKIVKKLKLTLSPAIFRLVFIADDVEDYLLGSLHACTEENASGKSQRVAAEQKISSEKPFVRYNIVGSFISMSFLVKYQTSYKMYKQQ